jgi:hypothetical protein
MAAAATERAVASDLAVEESLGELDRLRKALSLSEQQQAERGSGGNEDGGGGEDMDGGGGVADPPRGQPLHNASLEQLALEDLLAWNNGGVSLGSPSVGVVTGTRGKSRGKGRGSAGDGFGVGVGNEAGNGGVQLDSSLVGNARSALSASTTGNGGGMGGGGSGGGEPSLDRLLSTRAAAATAAGGQAETKEGKQGRPAHLQGSVASRSPGRGRG